MGTRTVTLPQIEMGTSIPRVIYQKYSVGLLTSERLVNIERIKALNPTYVYRSFDDDEAGTFISENYGPDVLARFHNIKPEYGAARADLFRYLLLYRNGGVYLDLKSTTLQPLAQTLAPDDSFILSQWDNGPGRPFEGYGLHKELTGSPGGEFQQWFLVSVPGHPFLRAVIERVLTKIDDYRPWKEAVSRLGVIRTTGPIPFTQAILPIVASYPHRRIRDQTELGLEYTIHSRPDAHVVGDHYWLKRTSITHGAGRLRKWFRLYGSYMRLANSHKVTRLTGGILPLNRER